MRGSKAVSGPSGPPRQPEGVDLSLTGLPPPVSRRPTAPLLPRFCNCPWGRLSRFWQEAPGPGGSPAINNLRRSAAPLQVNQPQASRRGPGPSGNRGLLGSGPRSAAFPPPAGEHWRGGGGQVGQAWTHRLCAQRSRPQGRRPLPAPVLCLTPDAAALSLGRSNKGAVGNCVTGMVHNHYTPSERTPPPKSSNHTAPPLNNILKAATDEGESSHLGKPQKNVARSNHAVQNNSGSAAGLLRWKEVTEEEAERFIHQVSQAAVTIQRWYRHQVQQHQVGAAHLEHLLASKREVSVGVRGRAQTHCTPFHFPGGGSFPWLSGQGPVWRKPSLGLKPALLWWSPPLTACPLQDASSQDTAGKGLEALDPARGKAKSRATLDELLDTLKLLEQEPEPLPRPRAYHKDKYAWIDEVTEDDASSLTADNLEKFGKLSAAASPPEDGTLLSEAKLQSIMSFLDEMERSEQGRPASAPQGPVPAEGQGRLEPAAEASTSVMRLRLEVEEKKQAMVLLQRALAQQRDLTVRRVKETEKELGRQLRQQREHYEATIQRHLSFIDQLIEDKKVLGEKCEALVAELKQGDQRRKDREAQMQEQHELEIKKLKELMSATEKVRREKWINEKTRKIKEITVKGLEPEIQKLIAKHKQEVKKLKSLHATELLQAEEHAAQRYSRQAEELREHLEREKEALGRQEWERAQQRFEQHLEQEQRALQQQRRRLYNEVAEEKERLGQQAARQRAELEELRLQLEESSSAGGRALRAEFEKGREELERRHQMELKALKDQLEVERQMWEANSAKKEEAWLLNRERELKEEIRRGRDKEIELVIHRLEADMTLAREESERAAESRVKRVRDKYEAELSELEQSERKLQERCTELKGRLGEAEGENVRLQALVRQKEKELADMKAVNEQLAGERSSLAQVLRQEFADRLAASEEENRQVKAELAELRKQAEVKTALAKKEEAVSSLRKQHEAALKRADHLEELLGQRRRPSPSTK
uniref:Centrosomal protein 131 n=1 Tax=Sus scrofa TaxID=9823 RepID=F1RZA9_PIG